MKIELPEYVKGILNKLNEGDYSSYIVGGCVRDSILGLEPKDWDITTNATPDQIEHLFACTIPTGKQYGTITVVWPDECGIKDYYCEVTTFRADGNYGDGRRPDVVSFSNSISDDVARRDFTINAMAYNDIVGLVDIFEGQKDLEISTLRAVGDPIERFNEDALRILRGLRFAVKYNLNIEDKTKTAMFGKFVNVFKNVSKERIHDELIKILTYSSEENSELINEFAPFIFELTKEKYPNNRVLSKIICTNQSYLYKLFVLLAPRDLYKMEEWMREYKFSNQEIKTVIDMAKIDLYDKKYLDVNIKARELLKIFDYKHLIEYLSNNHYYKDIYNAVIENSNSYYLIRHLAINGNDLKERKEIPEKDYSKVLNYLLNKVIENQKLNCPYELNRLINDYIEENYF